VLGAIPFERWRLVEAYSDEELGVCFAAQAELYGGFFEVKMWRERVTIGEGWRSKEIVLHREFPELYEKFYAKLAYRYCRVPFTEKLPWLEFSNATLTALRKAGVEYVYELLRKSEAELQSTRGIGPKHFGAILWFCQRHGFELRPE